MNSIRMFWLKLVATVATLLAGGCLQPFPVEPDEGQQEIVVDPLPVTPVEPPGSAVSFSMDAEQFANLASWLAQSNTLSIEKPVHIERDNVTLDAKAGTRFSYAMADNSGVFTFEKPFPTVKAGIAKLIGGVSLQSVTINADGSGVAGTGLGRYRFRWSDSDGLAAAVESLPEVWAYSSPGCAACEKAKREFEAAEDLPFIVIWKEQAAPTWLESRPGFWWHVNGKQPSQADVANTRQHQSWTSLKDFLARWKATREPKQSQRAGGPAKLPFVRPDRSKIGSRSVAIWSINGSHTPSRSMLLDHLSNDGIHRGRHARTFLESLTTEQLRWLHDCDHGK